MRIWFRPLPARRKPPANLESMAFPGAWISDDFGSIFLEDMRKKPKWSQQTPSRPYRERQKILGADCGKTELCGGGTGRLKVTSSRERSHHGAFH